MAYSLRLPDALDAAARAKADYLGISLNALLCVALDVYLRTPMEQPNTPSRPGELCKAPAPENPPEANDKGKPSPPNGGGVALTRAQKQALYEQEEAERKRLFGN